MDIFGGYFCCRCCPVGWSFTSTFLKQPTSQLPTSASVLIRASDIVGVDGVLTPGRHRDCFGVEDLVNATISSGPQCPIDCYHILGLVAVVKSALEIARNV